MISTAGATTAIRVGIARSRLATFLTMLSATRTWTITAAGDQFRNTAPYGFHTPRLRVGSLTATATGSGFRLGAGRGLTTRRGVLLRSTMAAGLRLAVSGVGYQLRRAPQL